MKILLIYYTGTYNTRFLSNKIKERFILDNHEVELVEFNKDAPTIDASNYDLIGLGYPIYGFNSPKPFNQYLKSNIKFKKGQKYFIYKNSGETFSLNNASSRTIKNLGRKRKIKLVGEYHFVLPYNIHFPFEENFIKEILQYNEKLLDILIYNLKQYNIKIINSNIFYDIASFFISIQKVGGPINSFFYKVDNNKCIKCMKCINECPSKNIYIDKKNKIKFHHDCYMCMRCSFYCPANAINIGFLNSWKVSNYYNLYALDKDKKLVAPYIKGDEKGFYKCFKKYFDKIEKEYQKISQNI